MAILDFRTKKHTRSNLEQQGVDALQQTLNASTQGLSSSEAKQRLEQYGYNEISEKTTSVLRQFLSYFWGPIPWMIEAALVLSLTARHWPDFFIILVLLLANAVIGFWEEHQAGNAIAALKAKLALNANVLRDAKWCTLPARELVPGDVIALEISDVVPADARLLEKSALEVDQSALTGESLPVNKGQGDNLYSGSIVRQGEGHALVYATGLDSYFGHTAQLVEQAHTVSHFQRAVLKIGNYLIVLALALIFIILAIALFRGDDMLTTVQFALVLCVAAIPVAMPTVLSVTMAVGARLLAAKETIVTRLSAIEELAGVDVLCSDKTGTLTQNALKVECPFCLDDTDTDSLLLKAALACRPGSKDPIDKAILAAHGNTEQLESYSHLSFTPFDPVRKRTESQVRDAHGNEFTVSKGAPQVILALVENREEVAPILEQAVNGFAARGFRSLAIASHEDERGWQLKGILPLFDPPREEAAETIATAKEMGIRVKMITGDQVAIARETAKNIGIGDKILNAAIFEDTKAHEAGQLADAIENTDGFAQVYPDHKYFIVDTLQQQGHIVGMTGDGVNDAPALKKADCGIAVSGATDAARAAASIVLLSPGLSVIIDAVKQSRKIFQRMTSYAIYRIAETLRVLLFMTLSILAFNFYPLTAVMIVMLALLNDGAILAIAYDKVRYKNSPEVWNMPVVLGVASVLGVFGVISSFGLFYIAERMLAFDQQTIQVLLYLKLSVAGHLTIFVTRTRGPFWSIRPSRGLFFAVLITQCIATLIAVYGVFMPALGWQWAGAVWLYSLTWFLINDRVKILAYRVFDPNAPSLLAQKRHQSADDGA